VTRNVRTNISATTFVISYKKYFKVSPYRLNTPAIEIRLKRLNKSINVITNNTEELKAKKWESKREKRWSSLNTFTRMLARSSTTSVPLFAALVNFDYATKGLTVVKSRFASLVVTHFKVDSMRVGNCLDSIFASFDLDNTGKIDPREFVCSMKVFDKPFSSPREMIARYFFFNCKQYAHLFSYYNLPIILLRYVWQLL
jgi:hypothetical protein